MLYAYAHNVPACLPGASVWRPGLYRSLRSAAPGVAWGTHPHVRTAPPLAWRGPQGRTVLLPRVLVSGIFPRPARPRLLARRRGGSSVGSLRWLVVGAAEWKSTRGDNAARERMPIGERERERERESSELRAQSPELKVLSRSLKGSQVLSRSLKGSQGLSSAL